MSIFVHPFIVNAFQVKEYVFFLINCSDREEHGAETIPSLPLILRNKRLICLNKFRQLESYGAQNKGEEFDTKDEETVALPVDEERSKLADSFYRLEHQEEDLINKKVESLLVRL
ncbi:hypothetical protein HanRHA438_Chr03g0102761 [Helianthus annuus]|uniref:Uncharacterized protein n=1 Tax=Helianthus annuus TaxID=4232 RepID=A0A251V505_HELAN|nr:hypothetical protein HanRHA438_Chr03g0102761 [Helianthus annuus]